MKKNIKRGRSARRAGAIASMLSLLGGAATAQTGAPASTASDPNPYYLGVSQAKLESALKSLRDDHEADREKKLDELSASVAKTLNLDQAKVKAALEDLGPGRGPGFRHP